MNGCIRVVLLAIRRRCVTEKMYEKNVVSFHDILLVQYYISHFHLIHKRRETERYLRAWRDGEPRMKQRKNLKLQQGALT